MIQLERRDCPLCGPSAGKKVKYPAKFSENDLNEAIFSARRTPDRIHFQLVECDGCQTIYSDPCCDPSKLANLYQESIVNYSWQEQDIYLSYAPLLDRALPYVKTRGTFVEVGGGNGFMLKYGAEHGFAKQIEIEPSSDAEKKFQAPSANAKFIRGVFVPGTLPSNSVDLMCFFQMLDHVPDPYAFLCAVYDALAPGGVALCVTHNTQAWTAKCLGEKSPIYDIEHTFLYNPSNLGKLFEKAKMKPLENFGVRNNYPFKYWMNLAPMPRFLKKKVGYLGEKTNLLNFRLNVNFGNFGIIAQKPF